MRIVLDINVIISALLFGGNPRRILERVILAEAELILSEPILEELTGVLQRPKFRFPPGAIQAILAELTSVCYLVRPATSVSQIREDPADNRILECAVEGRADYIVSGDGHLLDLKQYKNIPILNSSQFLILLQKHR